MRRVMIATCLLASSAGCAAELPGGARYVSMGSSYAAGPGVGQPDPASGGCGRSQSNYARRIAARHRLRLVDVSCSGATTDNILLHGQHGFPAQIAAVTSDTDLVTILIGGNDIGYVTNLMGYSCQDGGGADCDILPDGEVDRRIVQLPATLHRVIDAVRRRAPHAHIVMIGYLPALPSPGDAGVCQAVPMSPKHAARMRRVTEQLAQAIDHAGAEAHVAVIRPPRVGRRHDACAAMPFLTGYHPPRSPAWQHPVPYHPNQAGMDAIAREMERQIFYRPASQGS